MSNSIDSYIRPDIDWLDRCHWPYEASQRYFSQNQMIASMALDLIKKALVDKMPLFYSNTCIAHLTMHLIDCYIDFVWLIILS